MDTSVLVKWFHSDGELELEQAQWHLLAHREGLVDVHVLDLGIYELGNVLIKALAKSADETTAVIAAVLALCGPPLVMSSQDFAAAASIAEAHRLSYYDASFVAAAQAHHLTLVSSDRQLVDAGTAVTLTESRARLL